MGDTVANDTILQSRDNRALADYLTECLRPGFSGENEIGHANTGFGRESVWWNGEKMIAGLPATHKEVHCRCFLPDLAEFVILCCAGPGYQKSNSYLAERVRFELTVLAYTRVPGVHLKPLGHLSISKCSEKCVVLCKPSLIF